MYYFVLKMLKLVRISTAIKLIKYNLTDESKFKITGKYFMEAQQEQLHYCKSNPVKLTFLSKYM